MKIITCTRSLLSFLGWLIMTPLVVSLSMWKIHYETLTCSDTSKLELLSQLAVFSLASIKRKPDSSSSIRQGRAAQTEHNLHSGLTAEQKKKKVSHKWIITSVPVLAFNLADAHGSTPAHTLSVQGLLALLCARARRTITSQLLKEWSAPMETSF